MYIHSFVNIIFKIMLVGKNIFVVFFNFFVIRNFKGRPTCSSIEMLKSKNTCPKPKPGQRRQTINESVCCFD